MIGECGSRIADCGGPAQAPTVARRGFCSRVPKSENRSSKSGFTLVELLVTISIIAILAGLVLGVAGVAAETGREAKSKQMITRLHTLVMEHYDTYRNKRVTLRSDVDLATHLNNVGLNVTGKRSGEVLAIGRLAGAREQMKMEMPDRWSDFVLAPIGADPMDKPVDPNSVTATPLHLARVPTLAEIYRRRYVAIWDATNTVTGAGNTVQDIWNNQGAECLYMTVMYATGDGEARGLFKEADIGDTDGDGAPEFLDGWGNPVDFLRWAPGYASDLQLSMDKLVLDVGGGRFNSNAENSNAEGQLDLSSPDTQLVADAIAADHDPLDLFRVDQPYDGTSAFVADAARGFRLVPLISSWGRDEDYGIRDEPAFANAGCDPYFNGGGGFLGEPIDRSENTHVDNITNHNITAE